MMHRKCFACGEGFLCNFSVMMYECERITQLKEEKYMDQFHNQHHQVATAGFISFLKQSR